MIYNTNINVNIALLGLVFVQWQIGCKTVYISLPALNIFDVDYPEQHSSATRQEIVKIEVKKGENESEMPTELPTDVKWLCCQLWSTGWHAVGNTNIYKHTHTHTHIYIYICGYIRSAFIFIHTYIHLWVHMCVHKHICIRFTLWSIFWTFVYRISQQRLLTYVFFIITFLFIARRTSFTLLFYFFNADGWGQRYLAISTSASA